MKKKTVVIGISGGVDSSVAAKLLIDDGYNVIGLFMHNWEETEDGENESECTSADDWKDAQAVCGKLGIPVYSVNFSKEYMERVFKYFLDEYKKGRTPNPDVLCNREIKFGPFWQYAKELGADYIATGHYCGTGEDADGVPMLLKATDENKDQTYFLNQVKTQQLKNVLFPLSGLTKPQIRAIAEKENLVTARKKDSTGICFIGERNFKKFLKQYLPAQKGDIVDTKGKKIGSHDGLMYYTLGQRRGLNIGGIKGENPDRWYVVEKDLSNNRLIVSCGEGEELLSDIVYFENLNIIGAPLKSSELNITAKTRYRQPEQTAKLKIMPDSNGENTKGVAYFDNPQRAVTPGQYIVFYDKNRCLGGAVIEKTEKV